MHCQKFAKKERLSGKKQIDLLFEKGKKIYLSPFHVRYLMVDSENQTKHQILILVPKKVIKSAVQRNKIKRRIKESYRKNKFLLKKTEKEQKKYIISYIFFGSLKEATFVKVETAIRQSLQSILKHHVDFPISSC